MEKIIIIFLILASIFYIQNKLQITEGFEGAQQSLGGVDDTNAINTLAQIAKNLMAGGVTIPGNMNIQGDLVFPNQTTIKGAGRLHIGGEELLYILNKKGVMIGREWGGTGDLQVQGHSHIGGNLGVGGSINVGADINIAGGKTIACKGRLHTGGEEYLYILNKAGVMIGREWGGNGNLNVQGDLIVQGRNILAELNDLRARTVKYDDEMQIQRINDGLFSQVDGRAGGNQGGRCNTWTRLRIKRIDHGWDTGGSGNC